MITRLEYHAKTQRAWNGRDDIRQHYLGRIPLGAHLVTLSLTWRKKQGSKPCFVGNFQFDMSALAAMGFVHRVEGYYVLRFQRTEDRIEIAINRMSPAYLLSFLPKNY